LKNEAREDLILEQVALILVLILIPILINIATVDDKT